jgi:hypothetical protein
LGSSNIDQTGSDSIGGRGPDQQEDTSSQGNDDDDGGQEDQEATPALTPVEEGDPGEEREPPGGALRSADEVYEDLGDENEFTSRAGQIYVEVLIKGGPTTFSFTEDTDNGCYQISGLGTSTVTVNRVGEGRDCKEIGGLGLVYGE